MKEWVLAGEESEKSGEEGDSSFFTRVKRVMTPQKLRNLAILMGGLGILLILLSEFLPSAKDKASDQVYEESVNDSMLYAQAYRKDEEARLEAILSRLDGVGQAYVYLTVSCTEEVVYAKEESLEQSEAGGQERKTYSHNEKYVIVDKKDGRQPLVTKTLTPKVGGVVVLCQGGGKPVVAERVANAVSRALELPTGKVYVAPLDESVIAMTGKVNK